MATTMANMTVIVPAAVIVMAMATAVTATAEAAALALASPDGQYEQLHLTMPTNHSGG